MNRQYRYYVPAPDYEIPYIPEEPDPYVPLPDYGSSSPNVFRAPSSSRPALTRMGPAVNGGLQRSPPNTAQGHFQRPAGLHRSPPNTARHLQPSPAGARGPGQQILGSQPGYPRRSPPGTTNGAVRQVQPSPPIASHQQQASSHQGFPQRSPPATATNAQRPQLLEVPAYESVPLEQQRGAAGAEGRIYESPRPAAVGSDESAFREESEYEYRLEKALPSPEQKSPKGSIKDYIKAIGGVPVLPPLAVSQKDVAKMEAVENLAFRHHVINHRKFDTLNSFKSCERCPICQSMSEGEVPISIRHRGHRRGQTEESSIISGKAYEKIQEDALEALEALDQYVSADSSNISEEPETMPEIEEAVPNLVAQAIRDFEGRNADELSVKQGEILEVLQRKDIWWKCRNGEGQAGWVPVQEIYVMSVE